MNKKYIIPSIEIVEEAVAQLMAGSSDSDSIKKGNGEGDHKANSKQSDFLFDDEIDTDGDELYKPFSL